MSLDVGIEVGCTFDARMTFDNDGYYWYLHPLFEELATRTGIHIDLYDDARFPCASLEQLRSLLAKAMTMVSREPESWDVCTGIQTFPVREKIFARVSRQAFLAKLRMLKELVDETRRQKGTLLFVGD